MIDPVSVFLAFAAVFVMLVSVSVGHRALWNGDISGALTMFACGSVLFVLLIVLIRYSMFLT